jgi:hypothetical protein
MSGAFIRPFLKTCQLQPRSGERDDGIIREIDRAGAGKILVTRKCVFTIVILIRPVVVLKDQFDCSRIKWLIRFEKKGQLGSWSFFIAWFFRTAWGRHERSAFQVNPFSFRHLHPILFISSLPLWWEEFCLPEFFRFVNPIGYFWNAKSINQWIESLDSFW